MDKEFLAEVETLKKYNPGPFYRRMPTGFGGSKASHAVRFFNEILPTMELKDQMVYMAMFFDGSPVSIESIDVDVSGNVSFELWDGGCISNDGCRWYWDGNLVSLAEIAEKSNIPVGWFLGIQDAMGIFQKQFREYRDMAYETMRESAFDRQMWNTSMNGKDEFHNMRTRHVLRDVIRKSKAKMKSIASRRSHRFVTQYMDRVCNQHKMPRIPKPVMTAEDVKASSKFDRVSGVYIAWDSEPVYVGKSINIGGRVPHENVRHEDLVSVIEFPSWCIGRMEAFYIWLLNPSRNREYAQEPVDANTKI